jgi:hypothetical protein
MFLTSPLSATCFVHLVALYLIIRIRNITQKEIYNLKMEGRKFTI